jgi:hypothetical protein
LCLKFSVRSQRYPDTISNSLPLVCPQGLLSPLWMWQWRKKTEDSLIRLIQVNRDADPSPAPPHSLPRIPPLPLHLFDTPPIPIRTLLRPQPQSKPQIKRCKLCHVSQFGHGLLECTTKR